MVISMWMYMAFSTTLVVYPLFLYWSTSRTPGKASMIEFLLVCISQTMFLLIKQTINQLKQKINPTVYRAPNLQNDSEALVSHMINSQCSSESLSNKYLLKLYIFINSSFANNRDLSF